MVLEIKAEARAQGCHGEGLVEEPLLVKLLATSRTSSKACAENVKVVDDIVEVPYGRNSDDTETPSECLSLYHQRFDL